MKVTVRYQKDSVYDEDHSFYHDFIEFLQDEYPLTQDIKINFVNNRVGNMTTGNRMDKHVINVLTKNRMNRDILRTLSHEWVHEHQRVNLKMKKGSDIGGKNEDMANSVAGVLIKKFEKKFPNLEERMYN
jgi:hypothetical protein